VQKLQLYFDVFCTSFLELQRIKVAGIIMEYQLCMVKCIEVYE